MKTNVGTKKVDICVITFIWLILCVVPSLCVWGAAQPEAQGVVPNYRVAKHTRTQGPLLLFLLSAFFLLLVLLVLPLLGRLSPLLSC